VRELLRVRPAVRRHAGGQFAARGAGEQQLLAEARGRHRLQVEIAQADQVRDPAPFRLAGGPLGVVIPALAGGEHGGVPAQPPVAEEGATQVDPAQQVRRPAKRPGRHRCGDPRADHSCDHGGLGRGQTRVRGSPGVPPPRQPGDRHGRCRDPGDDAAGDVDGTQYPRRRPDEHDQRQRQPLSRGVQVPGPQPGPRRIRRQRPGRIILRVPGDRAGPGELGQGHVIPPHGQGPVPGLRISRDRTLTGSLLGGQAPSPVIHRPSCVIRPPLAANSRGSS
jgi:hypothetical protein